MFDGAVPNPAQRYWWDSTFFVQYLVDGLRELSRATGDPKYVSEARREADYCLANLRDTDGFYWRNMRLWTIDSPRTAAFKNLTGVDIKLTADSAERVPGSNPVETRPLVKTLLANAGTARMFWLLAH